MKTTAFAQRLLRDLKEKELATITADTRLMLLDAMNGAIQKLHSLAPHVSKEAHGSIYLAAPQTVSIGVTNGSAEVTGVAFTVDQLYCTIRLDGDGVDNQIISSSGLLHPYVGATGTVSATIFSDATILPEPYEELIGDPIDIGHKETLTKLVDKSGVNASSRQVGIPTNYWVEANAPNQSDSITPAVIRFHPMPGAASRYSAKFSIAPTLIGFSDITAPGITLPIRTDHVELYLLPIARGMLTTSELWANPDNKASVDRAAEAAEQKYEKLVIQTIATPANRVGTKTGF